MLNFLNQQWLLLMFVWRRSAVQHECCKQDRIKSTKAKEVGNGHMTEVEDLESGCLILISDSPAGNLGKRNHYQG